MDWKASARRLTELLALTHAPVGMTRTDAAPEGVAGAGGELPSACAFWRVGEQRMVFATAAEHRHCPIGVLTMGFEPDEEVGSQAQLLVGNMAELGYLDPEEVAHLPMLPRGHTGMLYGPAEQFPELPEVVLLICTPEQAMLVGEAVGQASMKPDPHRPFFGRPACSVIPRAFLEGGTEFSLACKGARILAELGPGEMLVAVPGPQLEEVVTALEKTAAANTAMASLYRQKRDSLTA